MNLLKGRTLLVAFAFLAIPLSLFALKGTQVRAAPTFGHIWTVNSTLDEPDGDPSLGLCSSVPSGRCTLRAAVMDSNFAAGPNTIILPSGVYTLTRPGYDDTALVGDLDLAHDVTIQGAGSASTIVDGNGSVTQDRVFQILSSVSQVTMIGLTIQNGKSLSSTVGTIGGGGILIEGAGHLLLRDVILDSDVAQNGGGLYANFSNAGGSLEIDNVVVHANTAVAGGVGAGGGLFVYMPSPTSATSIHDSHIYSNTADGTGGGIFVQGNTNNQWTIQRSELDTNVAASGGALGNFVPLVMTESRLHDNHVTFDGGAIETFNPLVILSSTLNANTAKRFGGAIFNLETYAGNTSYGDFAHISGSTLNGNSTQWGGAIYHDGFIVPASLLTLVNSTVSGNTAYRPVGATGEADGGGIYIYAGQAQLVNATVAFNFDYTGSLLHPVVTHGAGVYITATATFTALNSIIANNTRGNGIVVSTEDDCYSSGGGTVGELGFDLILNTTNCFITGPQVGVITGQDPQLAPLWTNGGPTLTHALRPGSPAIDNGATGGCSDYLSHPITVDQRGMKRPYPTGGRCDIGAFESYPYRIFIPVIMR